MKIAIMMKHATHMYRPFMQMAAMLLLFLYCLPVSYAMQIKKLPLGDTEAIVVLVDFKQDKLRLFLKDAQGQVYKSFNNVQRQLKEQHLKLGFAMNAGMFHPDYLPVGLYEAKGGQSFPLNTAHGTGNFFMQPNGVFLQNAEGFHVLSTEDYAGQQGTLKPVLATQSGPMLVIDGDINPKFNAQSTSLYVRNAVGVISPQHAAFVITQQPVSFYALADFFKNTLQIKNALYLDGSISSLYLPEMQRNDAARFLGPIIGVVQPLHSD